MALPMKKILVGIGLVLVICLPAILLGQLYFSLPDKPLQVEEPLPQIEVAPVNHSNNMPQEGRRVLFFFSPSCEFCEDALGQLQQLRQEHEDWFSGNRALRWVLVSVADRSQTEAFARTATWPIYQDDERKAMKELRGAGIPYLVLIDERGLVQYRHTGTQGLWAHESVLSEFYDKGTVKHVEPVAR